MTWLHNVFNFLALSLLRLFAFLPYTITVYTGYALGWLAAHIPNGRTHVVKTNLRLCFPNLNKKEIDDLALEHWKLFGRSVLERSRIWLGSGKQITDIVAIDSAITLGDRKPRLLINPHFVGLEGGFMALSVMASQHNWPRGAGLYQNMKNPFFNQKMIEWRNRFGGKSIERQSRLRDLIREIQTGNFIFIAPDIFRRFSRFCIGISSLGMVALDFPKSLPIGHCLCDSDATPHADLDICYQFGMDSLLNCIARYCLAFLRALFDVANDKTESCDLCSMASGIWFLFDTWFMVLGDAH